MKDIEKLMARGISADDPLVQKLAASTQAEGSAAGRTTAARKPPAAVIAGIAAAGLVASLLLVVRPLWTSSVHSVAGRVQLDGTPIGNVELMFHPVEPDRRGVRGVSASDGSFLVAGLASGEYRVTLRGAGDDGPAIPDLYQKPQSTKFRLKLQRDLDNVSLYAISPRTRR